MYPLVPKTSPAIRQRLRELRKQMTPAEKVLWERLRNRQLAGLKFRRQCPAGPYIVDFCCAQFRLVIEVDGGVHIAQEEVDKQRSLRLADHCYGVLRMRNEEILTDMESVCCRILAACQAAAKTPLPKSGEGQG